jgi:hypothetical protein
MVMRDAPHNIGADHRGATRQSIGDHAAGQLEVEHQAPVALTTPGAHQH